MGTDWSARMILGVQVDDADLFTRTTVQRPSCAHPEAVGQRFCPACGVRVGMREVVTDCPTAFLVRLGHALGVSPEKALDRLAAVDFHGIGFYDNADALCCSEDSPATCALGCTFGHVDERDAGRQAWAELALLAQRGAGMVAALTDLGLSPRPVGIFLSLCASV